MGCAGSCTLHPMSRLTWLPDALTQFGVPYTLVDGWKTRGTDPIDPRVVVCHHDALRSTIAGSAIVNMMIKGRPDLAGPLCNLWIDDDYDLTNTPGDPHVYVIAAGKSNNAGTGSWKGVSGNSSTIGIEARNTGLGESWSPAMLEVYERTAAACAWGMHRDASWVCGHKEWAPNRKIDPFGIDMGAFRGDVANLLHTGGGAPIPVPPSNLTPPGVTMAFDTVAQNADGRWEWFKTESGALRDSWQVAGQPQPSGWATVDSTHQWVAGSLRAVRGNDGCLNVFGTEVGTDKRMVIWQKTPNGATGWSSVLVYNTP